ncbi:hypothetical protein PENSPDRAFT_659929 [Peniophora sp. CONT]|nr:hypothetical protein PENSPDRAFT_659929 [Peniophora sp. CONT]
MRSVTGHKNAASSHGRHCKLWSGQRTQSLAVEAQEGFCCAYDATTSSSFTSTGDYIITTSSLYT